MKGEVLNIDCMEGMKKYPDKYFDLAIVDPPYGIGEDGASNHSRGGLTKSKKYYSNKSWDNEPMGVDYFNELFRVSKNQIIWGANHFISRISRDSSCWIVWDKLNGENDFADCELAWTSFDTSVRRFSFRWAGMLQGNMSKKEIRIHPTQKPVALYSWLLKKYSEPGFKILDTHLGSGSHRIAAYDMHEYNFEFVGFELDADHFNDQEKRFKQHIAQQNLFRTAV